MSRTPMKLTGMFRAALYIAVIVVSIVLPSPLCWIQAGMGLFGLFLLVLSIAK